MNSRPFCYIILFDDDVLLSSNSLASKFSRIYFKRWEHDMDAQKLDFNYNVSLKTINCIDAIDFTYHVNHDDYPYPHAHEDYFEFTVITEGKVKNITDFGQSVVGSDRMFVSTPNDRHYIERVDDKRLTIVNIIVRSNALKTLSEALFGSLIDTYSFGGNVVFELPKHVLYMIESNVNLLNSYKESEWKKANETLKATVVNLLSFLYVDRLQSDRKIEKWEFLLDALKTQERFYTYNVNELCEKLGYSRSQLNRLFFAKYGISPHDYLIESKLNYAAGLIVYTDYTVSEVCSMIGYANRVQFGKQFKKKFGLTPSEYKRRRGKA